MHFSSPHLASPHYASPHYGGLIEEIAAGAGSRALLDARRRGDAPLVPPAIRRLLEQVTEANRPTARELYDEALLEARLAAEEAVSVELGDGEVSVTQEPDRAMEALVQALNNNAERLIELGAWIDDQGVAEVVDFVESRAVKQALESTGFQHPDLIVPLLLIMAEA